MLPGTKLMGEPDINRQAQCSALRALGREVQGSLVADWQGSYISSRAIRDF